MEITRETITKAEQRTEMALITIGRHSGEFRDRKVDEFYFSDTELDLIKQVSEIYHASGKKVVVILNTGGVVETASWRDQPDAILLAWQGGQESGNSIADVLTGKVNPSGKLTSTFPVKYEDVPNAATFPGKELPTEESDNDRMSRMRGKPSEITYEDDIYVGYRYFDAAGLETAYEFGYGLSYTTFAYGKPTLSSKKFRENLQVDIEITNTGPIAGKEVVQLYLAAPGKALDKPVKELKAFAKTGKLDPGEKQVLSFTIDPEDLSSFDPETSAWTAEKGNYRIILGASSKDIRQEAGFKLPKALQTEETSPSLLPQSTFDTINP
jgi:beta-glucosidase